MHDCGAHAPRTCAESLGALYRVLLRTCQGQRAGTDFN
jgi:hypothetical protein